MSVFLAKMKARCDLLVNQVKVKIIHHSIKHLETMVIGTLFNRSILIARMICPSIFIMIKRSMMRRFPGRKQFMGNHLELVCLFQAVEI